MRQFVAAFIFLLVSISSAFAYSPPIGIPDPGFGIDDARPSRPSPWDTETPGYYYVNNSTGADSGRIFGTPAAPRATIPNPVPAGSYVEVHGIYSDNTWIVGAANGGSWVANTSGPAWIVGQDLGTRPDFTQRLAIQGSYVYVDTIRAYNGGYVQIGSTTSGYGANHIMVRNSEVQGLTSTDNSAITVVGSSTDIANNIVIYNNNLHGTGNVAATFDQDAHITIAGTNSSNVWFLENILYDGSGSGIQIGGPDAGEQNCHHIYFGKNTVYNARQAGVGVKYASDVVISQNTLHDLIDTRPLYEESASPSKGVGFQYAPQRLWILYNTISNASYGIYGGSTNGGTDWYIYAIGNVIHDIYPPSQVITNGSLVTYTYNPENSWSESGIMMAGGTYDYITNNTIYNIVGGIYCPSSTPYYMENNIVSKITAISGYHVFQDSGTSAAISTLKNSVIHQPSGTEKIRWGSSYVGTLASMQPIIGQIEGNIISDPLYINTSTSNYNIQSSSPAKEAGIVSDVYATFQNLYGINIAVDITGGARPFNTLWDIGAYEYGATPQAGGSLTNTPATRKSTNTHVTRKAGNTSATIK